MYIYCKYEIVGLSPTRANILYGIEKSYLKMNTL